MACLNFDFGSGVGELFAPGNDDLPNQFPPKYAINKNDSIVFQSIIDSNYNQINFSPFFTLRDQVTTDSLGFIVDIHFNDPIDTFIITNDFQKLTSLNALYLYGIQSIKNHSINPFNLPFTVLGIFQHKMDSVPSDLFSLTNLNTLRIEHGPLKSVSSNISIFKNLKWLSLFANNLDTLPATIPSLTKLEYLDLGRNNLCKMQNPVLEFYQSKQHYFDTTQDCP